MGVPELRNHDHHIKMGKREQGMAEMGRPDAAAGGEETFEGDHPNRALPSVQ